MKDNREFIPFSEVMDDTLGKKGSKERTEYDMSIELWLVGQKIKEIRESKKLTQEDLGKLIGVQKAQVSRMENGKNLTITTIIKVFKALNVEAKLKIEDVGIELALS